MAAAVAHITRRRRCGCSKSARLARFARGLLRNFRKAAGFARFTFRAPSSHCVGAVRESTSARNALGVTRRRRVRAERAKSRRSRGRADAIATNGTDSGLRSGVSIDVSSRRSGEADGLPKRLREAPCFAPIADAGAKGGVEESNGARGACGPPRRRVCDGSHMALEAVGEASDRCVQPCWTRLCGDAAHSGALMPGRTRKGARRARLSDPPPRRRLGARHGECSN